MDFLVFECWNLEYGCQNVNHQRGAYYAFDGHQSGHFTDLKTKLIEFYDDTSITEAKAVIWEHYKELALSPTWEANKVRINRGRSKKEKEVEDIMGAITIVESKFSSSDDLL